MPTKNHIFRLCMTIVYC